MSVEQAIRIDPDAGSYRGVQQDHTYEHDLGLIVLPVATREPNHRVIRLHGGYATRKVTWQSTRVGYPPMIPAASDTEGDTLLSSLVQPSLPVVDTTNTSFSWTVQGEYTYVQNSPRVAGENAFPAGNFPYLVLPQSALAADLVSTVANDVSNQRTASLSETPSQEQASTAINTLDELTEAAGNVTTRREDGSIVWPLIAVPAFLSSTHIIGG